MARHTIVIELPAGADPNMVEDWIRMRVTRDPYSTDGHGGRGHLQVIEYHYEQMTTTEENP